MAELTEEQKAAEEAKKAAEEEVKANAPKKNAKKKTYAELAANVTIIYGVTVRDTKVEDGEVVLNGLRQEKSASKGFWDKLPKFPKGHSKEGQPMDVNEGLKDLKLIAYIDPETGEKIKF